MQPDFFGTKKYFWLQRHSETKTETENKKLKINEFENLMSDKCNELKTDN
jgi:hypothetical protein